MFSEKKNFFKKKICAVQLNAHSTSLALFSFEKSPGTPSKITLLGRSHMFWTTWEEVDFFDFPAISKVEFDPPQFSKCQGPIYKLTLSCFVLKLNVQLLLTPLNLHGPCRSWTWKYLVKEANQAQISIESGIKIYMQVTFTLAFQSLAHCALLWGPTIRQAFIIHKWSIAPTNDMVDINAI